MIRHFHRRDVEETTRRSNRFGTEEGGGNVADVNIDRLAAALRLKVRFMVRRTAELTFLVGFTIFILGLLKGSHGLAVVSIPQAAIGGLSEFRVANPESLILAASGGLLTVTISLSALPDVPTEPTGVGWYDRAAARIMWATALLAASLLITGAIATILVAEILASDRNAQTVTIAALATVLGIGMTGAGTVWQEDRLDRLLGRSGLIKERDALAAHGRWLDAHAPRKASKSRWTLWLFGMAVAIPSAVPAALFSFHYGGALLPAVIVFALWVVILSSLACLLVSSIGVCWSPKISPRKTGSGLARSVALAKAFLPVAFFRVGYLWVGFCLAALAMSADSAASAILWGFGVDPVSWTSVKRPWWPLW